MARRGGDPEHSIIFRRQFITWLVFLMVRLVLILSHGYIHPDEFFQAPEPIAGDIMSLNVLRTWEFEPPFTRSIVFPAIICGIPFALLRLTFVALSALSDVLDAELMVSPAAVVIAPRALMFILSTVMDVLLYRMCTRLALEPFSRLAMFASSYVIFLLQTRTLSNSLEVFFLMLLLNLVLPSSRRSHDLPAPISIGLVLALGFFNRPSFALLAAPLCAYVLYQYIQHTSRWELAAETTLLAALSFLLSGAALALLDSLYFGTVTVSPDGLLEGTLTFAPLNNILYNTDRANLAEHGLHPRITHAGINMMILFGPGYLVLLILMAKRSRTPSFSPANYTNFIMSILSSQPVPREQSHVAKRTAASITAMLASAFCMLLGLSFFPHQEPRFLAPFVVPLCIVMGGWVYGRHRLPWLSTVWLAFNLLLGFFYGFAHQAGVIPSLSFIHDRMASRNVDVAHVVFAYTYMPPRHVMLTELPSLSAPCERVVFHDLGSTSPLALENTIAALLPVVGACDRRAAIYIVAPATMGTLVFHRFRLVASILPHVSLEYLSMRSTSTSRALRKSDVVLAVYERIIDGLQTSIGPACTRRTHCIASI